MHLFPTLSNVFSVVHNSCQCSLVLGAELMLLLLDCDVKTTVLPFIVLCFFLYIFLFLNLVQLVQ